MGAARPVQLAIVRHDPASARRHGSGGDGRPAARPALFLPVLVALLLLSACGGDSAGDPTGTAAGSGPTAAASPTAVPEPTIGEIVWAVAVDPTSNAPVEAVATIPVDAATIYAAVPVAGLRPGSVLTSSWTYNRTSLDTLASSVTVAAAVEAGWVEFHIARVPEQEWPDGTYEVAIALDGQVRQTGTIGVGDDSPRS